MDKLILFMQKKKSFVLGKDIEKGPNLLYARNVVGYNT